MKNRIISILLIISMITSIVTLTGCGREGEEEATINIDYPKEVSGILNEENLSISNEGVSLTIEEWSLVNDTNVTIKKVENPPPITVEDEEVVPLVYDFNMEGEVTGIIELRIPCDAPEEEVFAGYFNPETSTWEPVESYYDSENKTVVIKTNHLSTYGVFTIKNPNKRYAMLAFSSDFNLDDISLDQAIKMLETSMYDKDSFYQDSFDLVSKMVGIHGGITTNLVDVANGISEGYVPTFSEGLKKSVTYLGYSLTVFEILQAYSQDDHKSMVFKTIEGMTGYILDEVSTYVGTTSMAAGMFSVGLVNYALNEFIAEAISGRIDIYTKAYDLYYKEKGRSNKQWVTLIRKMVENGKDPEQVVKDISKELNRYAYEFWEDDTTVGIYGKEASPQGWSTSSLGGLNERIKKEISEERKGDLERLVDVILGRIHAENMMSIKDDIRKGLVNYQKRMNSIVNIKVTDTNADEKPSHFAGATLRFVDLPSTIEDPEGWQAVISDKGEALIRFRVIAHIMANSPRRMEIVKVTEEKEEVMIRFNAKFSIPDSKLDLADLYTTFDYPKNIGGSYVVSMYNTTTQKTIDDLIMTVNVTKEVSDGSYIDIYLENNGSVYVNNNYFYSYKTGKVNYALGEMSFSKVGDNGVAFKFDALDPQKKVWGSFTGQK